MPLALNPKQTLFVHLANDAGADPRPEFEIRFLSDYDIERGERLLSEAHAASDAGEIRSKLRETIGIGLVGWRRMVGRDNVAIPFGLDKVPEILTSQEMGELAVMVLYRPRASEAEKKSSSSPATSPPENSAQAAKQDAPKTLETNPST